MSLDNRGFATAIGHVLASERLQQEFRLEYAVVQGPRYGLAYEYEERLALEGNGQARLFRRRSPADTEVLPPGSYAGEIPKEELLAFLRLAQNAPLHAVPALVPSPQDPVFTLTVLANRKLFAFRWSPPQPPVPPELEPVLDTLSVWSRRACPKPLWSLSLKAQSVHVTGEGLEAALRFENAGSERIYVAHPASPGPADLKGLSIRHGIYPKETPGVTPLPMQVSVDDLAIPLAADIELVPIAAGSPLDYTVRAPAPFPGGGGRIGVFEYRSYLFPAGAAGLPVFAGAIFSPETPL
jgi:hypothetical protein